MVSAHPYMEANPILSNLYCKNTADRMQLRNNVGRGKKAVLLQINFCLMLLKIRGSIASSQCRMWQPSCDL